MNGPTSQATTSETSMLHFYPRRDLIPRRRGYTGGETGVPACVLRAYARVRSYCPAREAPFPLVQTAELCPNEIRPEGNIGTSIS